jgi:two-component system response regulator AdeR
VLKILIVEDNIIMASMYQKAFLSSDYEAILATNGQEGMEKVGTFQPDLILLDVRMPVIDGLEVLRRLKASPATALIPVVILTNIAGSPEVQAALDLGAARFVVKSETKPGQVEAIVRSILEDHSPQTASI